MAAINVYLTFDGECEEAFRFYQSVLGGEFDNLSRFGDIPPMEDMPPIPVEAKDRIMHVALPMDGGTILMGSDTMPGLGEPLVKGNNFSVSLNVNSREEADELFNGLSKNGKVTMPLENTFWDAYFGMWTDQFGIQWMVNFDDPANH